MHVHLAEKCQGFPLLVSKLIFYTELGDLIMKTMRHFLGSVDVRYVCKMSFLLHMIYTTLQYLDVRDIEVAP